MTRPGATPLADPSAGHTTFRAGPDAVVVAAPAKLNLFLEILHKRPDNYHELESLMVAVDLFDTLEIRALATDRIELTCEPATLSAGPDNLVHKAATLLCERAQNPALGAAIRLTKRIPTQAGLGGGSSDAAAALVGLSRIWKLALTREELVAIAASIGSDVAFFLTLPAAWCTGRGEITTPEPQGTGAAVKPGFAGDRSRGTDARALSFVLVFPPVGVSTADVYRRLAVPKEPVSGDRARAAFRASDAAALGAAMFNRLEEPAFAVQPLVGRIKARLARVSPHGAMMSGSGSTVFAPCPSADAARGIARAFLESRPADEPESQVLVVQGFAPLLSPADR